MRPVVAYPPAMLYIHSRKRFDSDHVAYDGAIGYNPAVTHTCRPTPDRPAKASTQTPVPLIETFRLSSPQLLPMAITNRKRRIP